MLDSVPIRTLLFGALTVLTGIRSLPGDVVTIVSPKGTTPRVVTTTNESDRASAEDLCNYLSRVSGRNVVVSNNIGEKGVVFHVGRDGFVNEHAPEIDKLFADGYILKCINVSGRWHVILAGRMPQSSQWAVEQFLKDYCGVRWLFPDPTYGEVVPSRTTVTIDSSLAKTYEPDYISRANCGMYYFTPRRKYLRLRPFGYEYGGHAIQHIFSTEEFKAHPEWFAFFKGKRQWWKYGNGWQICTTNPDTVKHTVKYVLNYFREHPDAPVVSIGQNDGAGWCECPKCTKFVNSFKPPYTLTERWFHWVNQVAKEVAKTYPDKWIEAMAYSGTSKPPRFPLEKNVAITKTIVHEWELKQAEQWKKVCKSVNLYSYMYGSSFLGFRHYPHAARDFLKWGHDELGALAHVTECGGDWTFDGPKYHYLQALQWDVNADVDAIMDDFCKHSYGTAAKPMREFWDRLEQIYERRGRKRRLLFYQWVSWNMAIYVQPNQEFKEYKLADVEFLDNCVAEAARLANTDTKEVQFRVDRISDAWKYYRTMLLSYLKYFKVRLDKKVLSRKSNDAALELARKIADLRSQRTFYLGRLRSYPHINPRMMKHYYWSMGEALTLFSHERALLDELCTTISRRLEKRGGIKAAREFWQAIPSSDNLYESAQTQMYMLGHKKPPNLLVNGDFETGDLKGWDVSGSQIDVVKTKVHGGKYAARTRGGGIDMISQKVSVSPHDRYRLTAWGKYLTKPPKWAVPLEAMMEFYSGTKRVWSEPSRTTVRTRSPGAGWVRLRSTITVPPGADAVVVKLKKTFNGGTTLWDDVALEMIKQGPRVRPGVVADDFTAARLDTDRWFQATGSGGTKAPRPANGWLIYDDKDMYPITSFATFDDLLKHKGPKGYCLKLHAAALPGPRKPSSFSWGIKTGTGTINIWDSGMFWTHQFGTKKYPKGLLRTYAYQNRARTHSGVYVPKALKDRTTDLWYTLYFDPQYVTIYAASTRYDESDDSLVAKYKHGITDITANGPVYLKLHKGFYMLDEINLSPSGASARRKGRKP